MTFDLHSGDLDIRNQHDFMSELRKVNFEGFPSRSGFLVTSPHQSELEDLAQKMNEEQQEKQMLDAMLDSMENEAEEHNTHYGSITPLGSFVRG